MHWSTRLAQLRTSLTESTGFEIVEVDDRTLGIVHTGNNDRNTGLAVVEVDRAAGIDRIVRTGLVDKEEVDLGTHEEEAVVAAVAVVAAASAEATDAALVVEAVVDVADVAGVVAGGEAFVVVLTEDHSPVFVQVDHLYHLVAEASHPVEPAERSDSVARVVFAAAAALVVGEILG